MRVSSTACVSPKQNSCVGVMRPRRWRLRFETLAVASILTLAGAVTGCTADGDPDAGLVPCDGSGTLGIAAGATGIDWSPLNDGDVLPTWDRPQGGIGTRINVHLTGLAEDAPADLLQTLIYRPLPGPAGGVGENGGECAIDLEGNGICNSDNLSCTRGVCREVITDQVNRQFPRTCDADGTLQVTEMPIRFFTRVNLADVDGAEAEIIMRLDIDDSDGEDLVSDPVRVILEVGDFIQPSWWDQ